MTQPYLLINKDIQACDELSIFAEFWQNNNPVIAKTRIGNFLVTTVFLKVDCNFSDRGSPVLFETMVFDMLLDKDSEPILFSRDTDYEYAEDNHQQMSYMVLKGEII